MTPAPMPISPLTATPLPDVNHLAELKALRQAGVKAAYLKARSMKRAFALFEHQHFHGEGMTSLRFEVEHIEDADEPELVGFLVVPTKLLEGGR